MKKLLLALFGFCIAFVSFGQTILNSHPLELKKSSGNHAILNAVNSQNQVFVFAADKENLKIIKYNSALFFSDSLTTNRPDKSYKIMAGYGFDKSGNPYLHWASEDYRKTETLFFDLKSNTTQTISRTFPFKKEILLNTFSENSSFYMLSLLEKEDKLKFYVFNDGILTEKIVDFSSYVFNDEKGKSKKFYDLISGYGIETINTKFLNPLYQGTAKIKSYIVENRMILTFDSLLETQAFEINLDTFELSEKKFSHQATQNPANSNSYFYQEKLYQMRANDKELIISATNYTTGKILKTHTVISDENITFKNSPLYSQTGQRKGKELKNTKKFLSQLKNSRIGLSAYKTPNTLMLTAGGIKNVGSSGGIMLGVALGVTGILTGTPGDFSDFFDSSNLQSIYFEGLFDDNFEHQNVEQQGLAFDYISQFMGQNKVALETVFPFKNYFILGYYDVKANQYVMRKFEDDHSN